MIAQIAFGIVGWMLVCSIVGLLGCKFCPDEAWENTNVLGKIFFLPIILLFAIPKLVAKLFTK